MSDLGFVQPFDRSEFVFIHRQSNKELYKECNRYVLEFSTARWIHFKDVLHALIAGESGHQYVDSDSTDEFITLVMSLNEYPPEWEGWVSMEHPYTKYESHPLWKIIERAIDDLVENSDLVEQTAREYIVGYICKKILGDEN